MSGRFSAGVTTDRGGARTSAQRNSLSVKRRNVLEELGPAVEGTGFDELKVQVRSVREQRLEARLGGDHREDCDLQIVDKTLAQQRLVEGDASHRSHGRRTLALHPGNRRERILG